MKKIINKVNLVLLLSIILFVPIDLIFTTISSSRFDISSFLYYYNFLYLLIPIQLFIYIYNLISKNTKISKYDVIIGILVILGIIVTINAFDVQTSIWGSYGRNEGLLTLISYYLAFLNSKSLNKDEIRCVIKVLFVVGILQFIYSILQVFVRWDFLTMFSTNDVYYMAGGFVGNPNSLGSYCIMLLCLAFMLYLIYGDKKYLILTIIFYVNLILSQSTGPFFTFILVFIFVIIFMKIKKVISWKKIGILICTFIVTFLLASNGIELYVTNVFGDRILRSYTIKGDIINTFALVSNAIKGKEKEEVAIKEEIVQEIAMLDINDVSEAAESQAVFSDNTKRELKEYPITETPLDEVGLNNYGSGRLTIWKNTLKLVPQYFWFGAGYDNFGYVYKDHETVFYYDEVTGEPVQGKLLYDKAHNDYLQLLLTGGIFNFVVYLLLLFSLFVDGVRSKNKFVWALLIPFIAYAIQAFLNFSVIQVAPVFYIIMGMLAGLIIDEKSKKKV